MEAKSQLESINKVLSTMAFTLIAILGIRQIAQDLIVPLLLAIFLTVLIYPVYKVFRKKGLSSTVSIILMIITFILGFGALALFIAWSFTLIADSVGAYFTAFIATFTQSIQTIPFDTSTIEQAARSIDPNAIAGVVQNIVRGVLGNFGNFIMYFVIIPMLAVLMLVQIDSLPKSTTELLSKDSKALERLKNFAQSITTYLSGRLKVNIVTGVLFSVALLVLGVDFAIVWGVLVIFMSFIPYIGSIIAGTPPTLLAFIELGPWGAVAVIASIALINLFAENILDPYIQGKTSKISTAAVVIALIFWTWLLGPVGALLSVPLTVSIKFILAEYQETHWIALLMEGNYKNDQSK